MTVIKSEAGCILLVCFGFVKAYFIRYLPANLTVAFLMKCFTLLWNFVFDNAERPRHNDVPSNLFFPMCAGRIASAG